MISNKISRVIDTLTYGIFLMKIIKKLVIVK